MNYLVALLCLVVSGCGLSAVQDCGGAPCRAGGFDAGSAAGGAGGGGFAGAAGGGIGGGGASREPADSGTTDSAMNDGGPTNTGPFSFDAGFASCADELDAGTLDTISVQGQLGALGNVHYTLSGYAAGMTTSSGVQRYVNVDYARVGPSREIGLEVWVSGFQSGVIALTGVTYEGTNFVQPSVPPFHQFINFHANLLTPDHVTCPDQQGHGRFVFAHIPNTPFQDPTPTEPYQGIYEFDCPDAGIHVSGCFSYEF